MTKKERELRAQLTTAITEARDLAEEGKMPEAKVKAEEVKDLRAQIDILNELNALELEGKGQEVKNLNSKKEKKEEDAEYNNAFFKAFKGKKLSADEKNIIDVKNSLSEGTDEDGGLILPQDIQTKINEYKRTLPQLEPLINVIPVTTLSGSRVFEKIATMTPLENITDDTADIADMGNPQFEKISYKIKKYAGWLPIPNDLLKDTDQNITAYLKKWIGKKSIVTRNTLILAIMTALTPVTFADYKAIKKALNITLDPMIAAGSVIVTNQDGFQYLDTLEDGNGKPILQVDVTKPTQKLFAGKPVKVIGNTVLKTTGTTKKVAPIFVGDPAELATMFERQGHQIASTNIGGTAFRKDRTEIRVIEREDVVSIDTSAVVYGKIDVTEVI